MLIHLSSSFETSTRKRWLWAAALAASISTAVVIFGPLILWKHWHATVDGNRGGTLAVESNAGYDFLWAWKAFEIQVKNKGRTAITSCILELDDGYRADVGALEEYGDVVRGNQASGSSDIAPGETRRWMFSHDGNNHLGVRGSHGPYPHTRTPSRVALRCREDTFSWAVPETGSND